MKAINNFNNNETVNTVINNSNNTAMVQVKNISRMGFMRKVNAYINENFNDADMTNLVIRKALKNVAYEIYDQFATEVVTEEFDIMDFKNDWFDIDSLITKKAVELWNQCYEDEFEDFDEAKGYLVEEIYDVLAESQDDDAIAEFFRFLGYTVDGMTAHYEIKKSNKFEKALEEIAAADVAAIDNAINDTIRYLFDKDSFCMSQHYGYTKRERISIIRKIVKKNLDFKVKSNIVDPMIIEHLRPYKLA